MTGQNPGVRVYLGVEIRPAPECRRENGSRWVLGGDGAAPDGGPDPVLGFATLEEAKAFVRKEQGRKRLTPGRPVSDNPLSVELMVRATPEQAARWRAAAEKEHLALSEWMRLACDNELKPRVGAIELSSGEARVTMTDGTEMSFKDWERKVR